jgi:hypothetical protein
MAMAAGARSGSSAPGTASASAGNVLTVDEEKRELEPVIDTARNVWGYPPFAG